MILTKLREYVTVVAISIAGSAATTYFTCTGCHSDVSRYLWVTTFSALLWISLWIGNGELTQFISKKISWVTQPGKRFIVGVVSTTAYTVFVAVLISKIWERVFNFNFGNYYEVVVPALIITFFISLFLHGKEFLVRWRKSEVDAERLQKENVKAQYESLKNQVNPHFLFNSLNALTNLVYEDQNKAVKFIKQLSDVYRYVLDTRDRELVSIQEEVKFLESYGYLQQIRFGSKLVLEINLKDTVGQIAPLALQMLIENAIKHNVIAEDRPLTIKVMQQGNYLVVENNLQKKTILTEASSGLGLENIRKRYEFLTDRKVIVEPSTSTFRVELPIITT